VIETTKKNENIMKIDVKEAFATFGGTNRLKVMVGAKNFSYHSESNYIQFDFKGSKKANVAQLVYDYGNDLYNLVFFKFKRKSFECPEVARFDGLYADMVKETFENETGLYLSL